MKQINYTGDSKLIARIVDLLNHKAPMPLDGQGNNDWGTNGQVLTTDGQGNTSWTTPQGGGGDVTDVEVNGTSVVNAQGVAEVSVPTATSDLNNDSGFIDGTDLSTALSDYTPTANLATVATSGDYDDLINKPSIPAAQVNSDWDAVSGVAQILNKPSLATVATSGSYNDLSDKPTIPAAQVQSDWSQADNTQPDFIKNKPTIPTALADLSEDTTHRVVTDTEKSTWNGKSDFSGSYNDLTDKPTIPTVNDGTLTIQQNGTTVGTFTANQSGNTTVNLTGGGGSTYTEGDGIDITNNAISVDTTFTDASTRTNIASGDTFATILGKIKKFFTDLKTVAFTGKSSDLDNDAGFITSSGTAANVSGTVAIVNGGTGATTRLDAAKNLTNESVTSPGWVVGLTNNWGKFGYTSLAELKTAMSLNNVNNTADANKRVSFADTAGTAGTATQAPWSGITDKPSTYPPSSHTHSYLPLSGGTLTGQLVLSASGYRVADGSGYYLDRYGNFIHLATNSTNYWTIMSASKTELFRVYFDSGKIHTKGSEMWTNANGTLCLQSSSNWLNLEADSQIQCRNRADNAWVPIAASSYPGTGSSRKVKENIKPLTEDEAKKILDIETVTFDYKETHIADKSRFGWRGVIAEDVEPIIPSAVVYGVDRLGNPCVSSVDYMRFVPYLIKMVQMQQSEIDTLKAEIAELKGAIK